MSTDRTQSDIRTESATDPNPDPTNERTHGRTKRSDPAISQLQAERAGGHRGFRAFTLGELLADDGKPRRKATSDDVMVLAKLLAQRDNRAPDRPPTLAQILDQWADDTETTYENDGRWPILRTGERDRISWLLRLSIYRRDTWSCVECGFDMGDGWQREWAELDHCIPWSAGGPDDSDNLRLLCTPCNQARSNRMDFVHARNYRPTTWWCWDCWSSETRDRRHDMPWRDGTILNGPLLVDDEQAPESVDLVYCAFCNHHSASPYPLVGALGRDLIADATRYVRYEVTP